MAPHIAADPAGGVAYESDCQQVRECCIRLAKAMAGS